MLLATATTLSSFLSDLGTIATQIFSWVGTVAETIVSHPLFYLTIGFLVVGGAIGIVSRLLSR